MTFIHCSTDNRRRHHSVWGDASVIIALEFMEVGILCCAIRAHDIVGGTHFQVDVSMVMRGACPDTYERFFTDIDFPDSNIVLVSKNPVEVL